MKNEQTGSGEVGLETGISYVLIGGVLISLVLDIVGMVLLSFEYGSVAIASDPSSYLQGKNFFSFIFDQFARRQSVTPGVFFLTTGILVRILTPYIRVVASAAYFAIARNFKYVVITLFVLVVITLSLVLH